MISLVNACNQSIQMIHTLYRSTRSLPGIPMVYACRFDRDRRISVIEENEWDTLKRSAWCICLPPIMGRVFFSSTIVWDTKDRGTPWWAHHKLDRPSMWPDPDDGVGHHDLWTEENDALVFSRRGRPRFYSVVVVAAAVAVAAVGDRQHRNVVHRSAQLSDVWYNPMLDQRVDPVNVGIEWTISDLQLTKEILSDVAETKFSSSESAVPLHVELEWRVEKLNELSITAQSAYCFERLSSRRFRMQHALEPDRWSLFHTLPIFEREGEKAFVLPCLYISPFKCSYSFDTALNGLW